MKELLEKLRELNRIARNMSEEKDGYEACVMARLSAFQLAMKIRALQGSN